MKKIYFFGNGLADGGFKDKNILGGKVANLAEMTNLGLPVPPGFTISTDICNFYLTNNAYPDFLNNKVLSSIDKIEKIMEQKFNDNDNPLLLSIRSGARQSMPSMMETVLNIGLSSQTIPGLIKQTNDERFVYDAYRRLITMYADVVMEKASDIDSVSGNNIRELLEKRLENVKADKNIIKDSNICASDLKNLCEDYKAIIKTNLKQEFPDDPIKQLWGATTAVFKSWNGKRACNYRKIEKIPNSWATAVNVQAMVFGNMGRASATGVAFTRNPSTGENNFYGEWLSNAQGEDVVAGIRTPNPLNKFSYSTKNNDLPSLEEQMPLVYKQLYTIQKKLENHYKDMQDIEFTIQNHRLWMLQTRSGKRTGRAAIRIAIDMVKEGLISEKDVLKRITSEQLDEIMHPALDSIKEAQAKKLATGLPAGPGGASVQLVFSADDAEAFNKKGEKVILVRNETSPEDVHGMFASEAILTARGGMTSHAALVARGLGKCCVVGCSDLNISYEKKTLSVNGTSLKEGDWLTLNGTSGNVYIGKVPLKKSNLDSDQYFNDLMEIADKHRRLQVRTNADSPNDVKNVIEFGAEEIGLCRTEHMFFEPERILAMIEMIIVSENESRRSAIMKLLPHQQKDFYEILKTMAPYPVTIRLLDPALHEFLPNSNQLPDVANQLNISIASLKKRIQSLHELNPMLGHRGCRLGISFPEITEMQVTAILNATVQLLKEGYKPLPEIMIPLVGSLAEFKNQKALIVKVANKIQKEKDLQINFLIGTMIELPRACAVANQIAQEAEFFSFGTNDLTQTTYGFSRDDIASFLPTYLENNIISKDPFETIDVEGVGTLVKMGVKKGRLANKALKIGICGKHGGDSKSINFFQEINLDYISCSPFRIPIARLAAAQSNL